MIDDFTTVDPAEAWPQRGRGGWWRNEAGKALVRHPNGTRKLAYDGGSSLWPFGPYDGPAIYGERGTHLHSICDCADRNLPLTAEFIAEGEARGISQELQRYIYARWSVFLKAHGFLVECIEIAVVNDTAKVATNIDRTLLLAGWQFVADIKSSSNVISPGYLLQLAACAGSVPYDLDTDERLEWDVPLDQDVGYILWFPLTAAIKAERDAWPDWTLVSVALAPGRQLLHQLLDLRDGKDYVDAFIILTGDDDTHGNAEPSPVTLDDPSDAGVFADLGTSKSAAEMRESLGRLRRLGQRAVTLDDARARYQALSDGDKAAVARYWEANDVDLTDADAIMESIDAVLGFHDVNIEPVARPEPTPTAPVAATDVDEGATIDDGDIAAAGRRYGALGDTERAWVSLCGGKVRLSPDHGGVASVRRFELLRGLCALAEGGFDDDNCVRAIAWHILGDIAWQVAAVVDVIAALDVDEARRFALIADVVATGEVAMAWTPEHRLMISPSVVDKAVA
jgi:hypothetical protein